LASLSDLAVLSAYRRPNMTSTPDLGPVGGSAPDLAPVGGILLDTSKPLKMRFRALFTLKAVGGREAVEWMARAFADESALLKHEVAYCLGQLQSPLALEVLTGVLADRQGQQPIVRHEAAEALANIGGAEARGWLERYTEDPQEEVRETCELAVAKLKLGGVQVENRWGSEDPAPPSEEREVGRLRAALLDQGLPLFDRYRAMFALRNLGCAASIAALAAGLACSSALFRHEIAFVLGQAASPLGAEALLATLRDEGENPMVRHEAAEALGDIPGVALEEEMARYLGESVDPVVRESCVIALDMADYNSSQEFQYADGLLPT